MLSAEANDHWEEPMSCFLGRRTIAWEEKTMLVLILAVVLVLALLGSLPTWPHSKDWGYYPSGGLSLVLVVLLILFLLGRL
jgi:hypothetical protein